ncbi:MAG TPA: NTP transferase domain-containing protein, partial [Nitrososphaera sp.]|nr:NTP transferase domain-containing protein [Nitrososphaera sp.]
MIALIMCGGRGTRMGDGVEKPLLRVGGEPLVQRVISALAASRSIDRLVAAVSCSTPETKGYLESRGFETVDTAGEGYSLDLSRLLDRFKPARVIVTPADMPLLNSQIVDEIASKDQMAPALSVILEKRFVQSFGIRPSVVLKVKEREYCHSGITIFDSSRITGKVVREEYTIMD